MRLDELMHSRVVTIDSHEPASAARSQMRKHRIRHLVVTAGGELAGVISERDLGGRLGEELRGDRTVEDLMSRRVVNGTPHMTLREAANLMRGHRVGSLPILDDGRLVGIVTATDVLDALGRGSARPTRSPELRTQRMTESRRQAARSKPKVVQRAAASKATGRARPRQPDSARRAPFAASLSKAPKREPPGTPSSGGTSSSVPAYIRATGGELGAEDRAYIRRKLGTRLGKFARAIERVSVRTEDSNGPRGGVDRVCRIKVVLRGLPSAVLERRDVSQRAAVDRALAGIEMAIRRTVQRRRTKPLRQAA